jgi:hypothetical protein
MFVNKNMNICSYYSGSASSVGRRAHPTLELTLHRLAPMTHGRLKTRWEPHLRTQSLLRKLQLNTHRLFSAIQPPYESHGAFSGAPTLN